MLKSGKHSKNFDAILSIILNSPTSTPWFVDTDNALGSSFGDIDDGIALTGLLSGEHLVTAISSSYGNTSEAKAYKNNQKLLQLLKFNGTQLHGSSIPGFHASEASLWLAKQTAPLNILALGPLSTIASALALNPSMKERISQIVFTGTNYGVRYPTNRFFDFNLSRDFDAFRALLESGIRMTAIPCNVCRRLRLRHKMLEEFRGPLGEHLQQESRRWFTRARILKLSKSVPAWDVVTALYSRTPPLFRVETHGILIRGKNVFFEYSERTIDVVTDFDQDKVWEFYFSLFR